VNNDVQDIDDGKLNEIPGMTLLQDENKGCSTPEFHMPAGITKLTDDNLTPEGALDLTKLDKITSIDVTSETAKLQDESSNQANPSSSSNKTTDCDGGVMGHTKYQGEDASRGDNLRPPSEGPNRRSPDTTAPTPPLIGAEDASVAGQPSATVNDANTQELDTASMDGRPAMSIADNMSDVDKELQLLQDLEAEDLSAPMDVTSREATPQPQPDIGLYEGLPTEVVVERVMEKVMEKTKKDNARAGLPPPHFDEAGLKAAKEDIVEGLRRRESQPQPDDAGQGAAVELPTLAQRADRPPLRLPIEEPPVDAHQRAEGVPKPSGQGVAAQPLPPLHLAIEERPLVSMNLGSHQWATTEGVPHLEDHPLWQKHYSAVVDFYSRVCGPPQDKPLDLSLPAKKKTEEKPLLRSLPGDPKKVHWKKQLMHFHLQEEQVEESNQN